MKKRRLSEEATLKSDLKRDARRVRSIDHGEGVAETDRQLIFEQFWRKTDAMPGTGLGLAIIKEIMNAHGGRIWVGETPGGGATFKLSVPMPYSK